MKSCHGGEQQFTWLTLWRATGTVTPAIAPHLRWQRWVRPDHARHLGGQNGWWMHKAADQAIHVKVTLPIIHIPKGFE